MALMSSYINKTIPKIELQGLYVTGCDVVACDTRALIVYKSENNFNCEGII